MSWVYLLIAAWVGFILGFVLCAVLNMSHDLMGEGEHDQRG